MKRRIIRLLVLFFTLILMVAYYQHAYHIKLGDDSLQKTVEKDFKQPVEITAVQLFEKDGLVTFVTDKIIGFYVIEKGFDGDYRLGDGGYVNRDKNFGILPVTFAFKTHLVVYGDFTGGNRITVEGNNYSLSSKVLSRINSAAFLTDKTRASISYVILTKGGQTIKTFKNDYMISNAIVVDHHLRNGSDRMFFITEGLILLVGLILLSYFAPGINFLERKFGVKAEHETESDPNDYTLMT